MRTRRIKTWIERVGFTLALLCAACAIYVDIASSTQYPLADAWLVGAAGIALLTWVLALIVGKHAGGQPEPPQISN